MATQAGTALPPPRWGQGALGSCRASTPIQQITLLSEPQLLYLLSESNNTPTSLLL